MDPVNDNKPCDLSTPRTSVDESPTPSCRSAMHSTWADAVTEKTAKDQRERPWKKTFGRLQGTLDDEDWINYPAMFDMAKKGIKG